MKKCVMFALSLLFLSSLGPAQEKAPPVNLQKALQWYKKNGIAPPQDLLTRVPSRVERIGSIVQGDEPDVLIYPPPGNPAPPAGGGEPKLS